jgi:hypothetical protein
MGGSTRKDRSDGGWEWRTLEGELHREDGPAIQYGDGTRVWWRDGKRHREDGPAHEDADGTRAWYRDNKLHREDGPALTRPDGTCEWWIDGGELDGDVVERRRQEWSREAGRAARADRLSRGGVQRSVRNILAELAAPAPPGLTPLDASPAARSEPDLGTSSIER